MKFVYFNDTKRQVYVHPATIDSGVEVEGSGAIAPTTTKTFYLPEGTYPWVKMWDHGSYLEIFVRAVKDGDE